MPDKTRPEFLKESEAGALGVSILLQTLLAKSADLSNSGLHASESKTKP